MLLDKKLILFDDTLDNLAATTVQSGDWVDVSGIGIESQDLFGHILVTAEINAPTAFVMAFHEDAAAGFGSDTVIEGAATTSVNPSSAAITKGSYYRFPLTGRIVEDSDSEVARYIGFVATYTGVPAADESILVWIGRYRDMPIDRDNLV